MSRRVPKLRMDVAGCPHALLSVKHGIIGLRLADFFRFHRWDTGSAVQQVLRGASWRVANRHSREPRYLQPVNACIQVDSLSSRSNVPALSENSVAKLIDLGWLEGLAARRCIFHQSS